MRVGEELGVKLEVLLCEGTGKGGAQAALGPGDRARTRPYTVSAKNRRPSGATVTAPGLNSKLLEVETTPPSPLLPG